MCSSDLDNTAKKHAEEFKKPENFKLNYFEEVPGEWHLQNVFIKETQKLKDSI